MTGLVLGYKWRMALRLCLMTVLGLSWKQSNLSESCKGDICWRVVQSTTDTLVHIGARLSLTEPSKIRNRNTGQLDLHCVYGKLGGIACIYLLVRHSERHTGKLLFYQAKLYIIVTPLRPDDLRWHLRVRYGCIQISISAFNLIVR